MLTHCHAEMLAGVRVMLSWEAPRRVILEQVPQFLLVAALEDIWAQAWHIEKAPQVSGQQCLAKTQHVDSCPAFGDFFLGSLVMFV